MPSKLSIYNGTLSILGERKLASLTENREPRYKLDDIWDNELIDRVLKMGQWKFAKRTVQLEASPSVTPSFGYQYAFDRPADFIRTIAFCQDEYFDRPITRYENEASWWFCDSEVIYVAYVSNDEQWGGDLALWPSNFTEMVEHYMAMKVAPRLAGIDISDATLLRWWKQWLAEAKATDAMEAPAKFPPKGGWARSRQGFRSGQNDRGNRSQLIG
ncbi:MAG: hypothetical protein AMJ84_00415 [Acidithiobacillales bacterium SM23_46]|nr:MAG: hypothetical protein AMJ84_00415 [Acidithiobacillales bacterium SM23_46]